jgi:hypothetical protein
MSPTISISRISSSWQGGRRAGWPRRFPLVQIPNPPLIVALVASLVHRLAHGWIASYASSAFYVALGIWAYGEAVEGVNWLRRLLGLGFLIYVLVRLARALHG